MIFAGRVCAAISTLVLLTACAPGVTSPTPTASPTETAKADAVMRIIDEVMKQSHLKAAIVRVTEDGAEVLTRAVGESMTGVPATPAMHFRNGAVAISYVSTLLLRLVDDGKVSLDDKLSKWLPDVPNSDRVTLRQLAQMTSGYVDYVIGNTEFADGALRGSLPAVGTRPTARLRDVAPAAVRPGNELELRPHQLRPARQGAGEGDRRGHAEAVAGEGAWPAGADRTPPTPSPRRSRAPCCTRSPANAARH